MTPQKKTWRVVDRRKRPMSRGTRMLARCKETGEERILYSLRELRALRAGRDEIIERMPGPLACVVRPKARYL